MWNYCRWKFERTIKLENSSFTEWLLKFCNFLPECADKSSRLLSCNLSVLVLLFLSHYGALRACNKTPEFFLLLFLMFFILLYMFLTFYSYNSHVLSNFIQFYVAQNFKFSNQSLLWHVSLCHFLEYQKIFFWIFERYAILIRDLKIQIRKSTISVGLCGL